ncbi:hypothetical protein DQ244_03710 [Blastococcus sp. TBT05-19]|uniref:hypothetical protein n=1 Tax=Blastococcus sp. TBT05-19 TaxID=2250581 RepID=UPI000DEA06CE|nr:hypothetical protein [Blastococcus sp. TBT05-19]RBY94431.1 hypothetical protein DQ244_03710 [Blastococcus sp. TBT05-19]
MTGSVDATVALFLPTDWCDVLIDDGGDPRAQVESVLARTWPSCPAHLRETSIDVLVRWRQDMQARGAFSHGIVSASTDEGAPVNWHVVTSVVALPPEPEIDLAQLLARSIGETRQDVLHVEAFDTEMGGGLGLVSLREAQFPPELAALGRPIPENPGSLAMAAALSYTPGTTYALLVVGLGAAPDQVLELAALVAVIAGRSRLVPATEGRTGR